MQKTSAVTLLATLFSVALSACNPVATENASSRNAIVLAYEPGLTEVHVRSQTGETLEPVATREGIDPARLRAWNPRAPQALLPTGTSLKAWKVLPGTTTAPAS